MRRAFTCGTTPPANASAAAAAPHRRLGGGGTACGPQLDQLHLWGVEEGLEKGGLRDPLATGAGNAARRPWAARCAVADGGVRDVDTPQDQTTQGLVDVLVEIVAVVYEYRNEVMLQAIDFVGTRRQRRSSRQGRGGRAAMTTNVVMRAHNLVVVAQCRCTS